MLTDLYFNREHHIQKNDLQLVGTAAMYIAAKIEEQVAVEVSKFAASTEWKYPAPMILDMEAKITKVQFECEIGTSLATQPTYHQHVGKPDNATVGQLHRTERIRTESSVGSGEAWNILQETRPRLILSLQPDYAAC